MRAIVQLVIRLESMLLPNRLNLLHRVMEWSDFRGGGGHFTREVGSCGEFGCLFQRRPGPGDPKMHADGACHAHASYGPLQGNDGRGIWSVASVDSLPGLLPDLSPSSLVFAEFRSTGASRRQADGARGLVRHGQNPKSAANPGEPGAPSESNRKLSRSM